MAGPLGVLLGMTFDVARNRYFPTPQDAYVQKSDAGILTTTSCGGGRGKEAKRDKLASHEGTDGSPSRRRFRRDRTALRVSARTQQRSEWAMSGEAFSVMLMIVFRGTKSHFASLEYQASHRCFCEGERITSLRVGGQFRMRLIGAEFYWRCILRNHGSW